MGKQQFNDTLKLGGTLNLANADPNDEQRMQYQQRMKADYAEQLVDMLHKLKDQKTADMESGQSNYQSALEQIANKKMQQKYKLAQLLYNAAKKGASGGYYDWAETGNLEDEYFA